VTGAIVPDQLKSAVVKSDRYEPEIQRTFHEFAEHYGAVVMPARPRHPHDKAKVEVAVQVVERWILARMRKETFYSLGEANVRIAKLLLEINERFVMRTYKGVRTRFMVLRVVSFQRFACGGVSRAFHSLRQTGSFAGSVPRRNLHSPRQPKTR